MSDESPRPHPRADARDEGPPPADGDGTAGAQDAAEAGGGTWARLGRALGPVLPGLVIDAVDAATFGPLGIWLGPLLGGPAGWFLARQAGLGRGHAALLAAATAVYCAVPFTAAIPVGTLVGAWARFVLPPPGER